MNIELNLNDQIKVKLTGTGKEILYNYYGIFVKPDISGYYNFLFWEFANIFGKEFHNGQMNLIIEDNKIIMI